MEFRSDNDGRSHLVTTTEVAEGLELVITRLSTIGRTYTVKVLLDIDVSFKFVMGYVNRITSLSNEHFILASEIGKDS